MEKVIIERLPNDRNAVAVMYYDDISNAPTDEVLEVMSTGDVGEHYNVVGEIRNGRLILYYENDSDNYYDYDYDDIIQEMGLGEEWLHE